MGAGKRIAWLELAGKGMRRLAYAVVASAVILGGCASAPKAFFDRSATGSIVWPGPPDKARIKYLWSISRLAGDGKRGVVDLLAGGEGGDVSDPRTSNVLTRPYAVFADRHDRLYFADPGANRVTVIDANSGDNFNIFEAGRDELQVPVGVVADPAGRIYVSDSTLKKVLVFDDKGKFLFPFQGDFRRPTCLAIDPSGTTIYVCDTLADTVYLYDTAGRRTGSIGRRGDLAGEFNFPSHLFVDGNGRLYVTDTMNFRVQIFARDGKALGSVGTLGDALANLDKPKGVAADSHGNIYVVDTIRDSVKIFNPQGELLLVFGEKGMRPGEFWLPAGIFVDRNNRIYVADPYNMRVQVFQLIE